MESKPFPDPYLDRLLARAQKDSRILALWVKTSPHVPQWVRVGLALEDEEFAAFYAERRTWLKDFLPFVHIEEITHFPASCIVLLSNGGVMTMTFLPWCCLPEYPPSSPRILFDRTRRLQARLKQILPPTRVEFARLETWAFRFWTHVWVATQMQEEYYSLRLYHAAHAYIALTHFLAEGEASLLDEWKWQGFPATLTPLVNHRERLPLAKWLSSMQDIMRVEGRRVAREHGWSYPDALERVMGRGRESTSPWPLP